MLLDYKLDFDKHIKGIFDKTSKSIGLLGKLTSFLPRSFLIHFCKFFVRLCLDYGGIRDTIHICRAHERGMEGLKFATCLQILYFLNNRSIVCFCRWRRGRGHKISHFLRTSQMYDSLSLIRLL